MHHTTCNSQQVHNVRLFACTVHSAVLSNRIMIFIPKVHHTVAAFTKNISCFSIFFRLIDGTANTSRSSPQDDVSDLHGAFQIAV